MTIGSSYRIQFGINPGRLTHTYTATVTILNKFGRCRVPAGM